MKDEKILGLMRHILTFAGGFIVAKGLADAAIIEEVIGAFVTIIGAIWSIKSKKSV
jgi:hypothetical protein